jgi:acetyltransferase-like isoleucine patch superfamily enzyme
MIGNHVHVATGARLAASIKIGDGAHIGIGATIREGIRIGQGSIVGAGAVVVDDVPDSVMVVGVPAKIKKGLES